MLFQKQQLKICKEAFYACKQLQQIEIPKNSELKIIGEYAFDGTLINKIFIPAGKKIGAIRYQIQNFKQLEKMLLKLQQSNNVSFESLILSISLVLNKSLR